MPKRIEPLSSRAQIVTPASAEKEPASASAMPKATQPKDSTPVQGNGTAATPKETVAGENVAAIPKRRDQIQLRNVALPTQIAKEASTAKAAPSTNEINPTQESTVAKKAAAAAALTPTNETAPTEANAKGSSLAAPRRLGSRRSRGGSPEKPDKSVKTKKKLTFWRLLWMCVQVTTVVVIIIGAILSYFVYEKALEYYAKAQTIDLKKLDDLNVTSTFYDVNGDELGRIFVEDRIVLKPDEIPNIMREAVMAAEDRRFKEHGAIDYWGILRAVRENFTKKSHGVQGASTIEQQLAKHLIGDFSRTLDRKFLEVFVARRLEESLTKDQIMNYYLNRIYFGKGYFGVEAAARGLLRQGCDAIVDS